MALFDVKKYETPNQKNVDMAKTRYNVGVFLGTYLTARSRVGQPREPKVTSTFALVPIFGSGTNTAAAEEMLIQQEEYEEEFLDLHKLFIRGYSAIQHPFKPEICERRKRIFYDRYINGYSVYVTAQRCMVSEDCVSQEAAIAIVQFAQALELVEIR